MVGSLLHLPPPPPLRTPAPLNNSRFKSLIPRISVPFRSPHGHLLARVARRRGDFRVRLFDDDGGDLDVETELDEDGEGNIFDVGQELPDLDPYEGEDAIEEPSLEELSLEKNEELVKTALYKMDPEQIKNFMIEKGWDPESIVDYRIDEEEFHKISLLDCDFLIRRLPDPDKNVYDFNEIYTTLPDTDVYAIAKILARMPQKPTRCAKTTYGNYLTTHPIIDAFRDPLVKTVFQVRKVFLTKHYENRRLDDPDFFLDFEEVYVLDSITKSITRATVVVTIPEGRERDRKRDTLIIRDNANSFKIIDRDDKVHPGNMINKMEWDATRQEMEEYLSKLRDFERSNWF